MISKEEFVMIHTLKAKGYSIRAIAKAVGLDRRTVAKRLKESSLQGYKKRSYASRLDAFKPYLKERIEAALPERLPATVLYREIAARGYDGSLRVVQRYLQSLKPSGKEEPIVRFETPPGKQAQADWTVIRSGKSPIYAFVMVLGYSRMAYVVFTENMHQATWQQCHEKAFAYFGGITETILYDNLKSVVIQRDRYGKGRHGFNDAFLDFCKGRFVPRLCRPYRAQTKGKVERFNRYLKQSFYLPLKTALKGSGIAIDAALLNSHLHRWLESANRRVHATTKERPVNRFERDEKALLAPWRPTAKVAKPASSMPVAIVQKASVTYTTTLHEYEKILEPCHACA